MSTIVAQMQNGITSSVNKLKENKEQIGKSFLLSFTITTIFTGNPYLGFVVGSLASLASVIHILVVGPIINSCDLSPFTKRLCANTILLSGICILLNPYSASFIAINLIGNIALNMLVYFFDQQNKYRNTFMLAL